VKRFFSTFLLGIALLTPMALKADHDEKVKVKVKRYYDRDTRDWHEWNEREERAYRHYLEEKRMSSRDWVRLNREQQREYWRWRHLHNDDSVFGDRH
jgi:hypothetical protein